MRARRAVTFMAVMLAVATAVLGAGCSGGSTAPGPGGSAPIPLLRIGEILPVPSLDETKSFYASEVTQFGLETLLQFGPKGQLEPDLATSVAQPNPVTYVYHLRHGVRFWDGSDLTAADVAYSWNYDRRPGSVDVFGAFPSVKTITAAGPDAVVVTLTHPDASWVFTPALAQAEIFEKKFALAHPGTFGKPGVLVMGTGPWIIDTLDPTTGAELSANPHWWGGKVPIQHLSIKIFSSETSLALAFRAGEVDLYSGVSATRSFSAIAGVKLLSTPSCNMIFFGMNTQAPPWNNIHVRRAVAYALNRTDLISANGATALADYTFIPLGMLQRIASQAQINALLSSIPLYQYNPAKARQELAESPYPHGFKANILAYSYGNSLNVFQVVAAELQKIGISAQIKDGTLPNWLAVEGGPDIKRMATVDYGGCSNPDVSGYDAYLGSQNLAPGQYNISDYAPAVVDHLLAAGVTTLNPAKRFIIYAEVLKNFATNVPFVPLFTSNYFVALSTRFTLTGLNYFALNGAFALNVKRAA
jgi:peptide/nickel transport system substrate-binding protein